MTISTGTAAWAPLGMSAAPTVGAAPKQSQHGSGLPFAGYAANADVVVLPTAVRTADAKVPDPRGRQR